LSVSAEPALGAPRLRAPNQTGKPAEWVLGGLGHGVFPLLHARLQSSVTP